MSVDLRNERYLILLHFASGTERYYRKGDRWAKRTLRGRIMPATAEQVLNHLLPALAGVKKGIEVEVRYRKPRAAKERASGRKRADARQRRRRKP